MRPLSPRFTPRRSGPSRERGSVWAARGGCLLPWLSPMSLGAACGSRGACGVQQGWGSACLAQPSGSWGPGDPILPVPGAGAILSPQPGMLHPPSGAPQPGWRSKSGGVRRSAGCVAAAPVFPWGAEPFGGCREMGTGGYPGQELRPVPAAALPGRACARHAQWSELMFILIMSSQCIHKLIKSTH